MGLDLLDLVFRLEATFQIKIKREEVTEVFSDGTVGALYQVVLDKLGPNDEPGCLGARVFYRLRPVLAETFDIPAEWIAPSAEMEALIPLKKRRQNWRRLARALDLGLPPLRRPLWLSGTLSCSTSVALILGGITYLVKGRPGPEIMVAVLAASLFKVGAAHALTTPYAVCFPYECDTVKGFIKMLLRGYYGRLARREGVWHPLEVWHILQEILVEALDVDLEHVKAEAHLARDLGAA